MTNWPHHSMLVISSEPLNVGLRINSMLFRHSAPSKGTTLIAGRDGSLVQKPQLPTTNGRLPLKGR
jgi:hypothetical protein